MTEKAGNPSGGESIDRAALDAVRLAHKALERFPELVRRHKFIAGGAAISTSLIVLAGVAIARRMRAGQTSEEALATVTEAEMQGQRPIVAEPQAEAAADPESTVDTATPASDSSSADASTQFVPPAPTSSAPAANGTVARPNPSTASGSANGANRTEAGHH